MTSPSLNLRKAFAGIKEGQAGPQRRARSTTRKAAPPPTPAVTPREARAVGKRGNPEFTQIGPYMRKSTKKAMELRLIQETGERDISGLIERLVTEWLAK
jgi:hypothetical protein